MKIQELRIGNWFIGYNGKPFQWSLGHFGLLTLKKNRPEIDDIIKSPIPLTEEILLKCGFEKDDTGVDMFDPDYAEWYQMEFPVIGILCQSSDKKYLFDENTDTLRIQYLHQLQNLYFALTGEELEVKL